MLELCFPLKAPGLHITALYYSGSRQSSSFSKRQVYTSLLYIAVVVGNGCQVYTSLLCITVVVGNRLPSQSAREQAGVEGTTARGPAAGNPPLSPAVAAQPRPRHLVAAAQWHQKTRREIELGGVRKPQTPLQVSMSIHINENQLIDAMKNYCL